MKKFPVFLFVLSLLLFVASPVLAEHTFEVSTDFSVESDGTVTINSWNAVDPGDVTYEMDGTSPTQYPAPPIPRSIGYIDLQVWFVLDLNTGAWNKITFSASATGISASTSGSITYYLRYSQAGLTAPPADKSIVRIPAAVPSG